ncbi:acyl carrier protein [Streptomyces lasalocidi]
MTSPDVRDELLETLAALPAAEALGVITDRLSHLLASVLQTDPADLDPTLPVTDFGLDSLLGVQFLAQARDLFAVRIAPADMATGRTLSHFARLIRQRLNLHANDAE